MNTWMFYADAIQIFCLAAVVCLCRMIGVEQAMHLKYAERARRYRRLTQFWRERATAVQMIPDQASIDAMNEEDDLEDSNTFMEK